MDIYSDEVKKILKVSKNIAYDNNNNYVTIKHVFNSILLLDFNISRLLNNINQFPIKKDTKIIFDEPIFSKEVKIILENSIYLCKEKNELPLSAENFLLSILKDKTNDVYKSLSKEIDINTLINKLDKKNMLTIVNKLGIELTDSNINNSFDKVIGRDEEINRIINILKRKNKNNPVLVGDAGVGKTAIVEELAKRISKKEVPSFLQNKKIISINISNVISGTKYRGEFEEKLTSIISEVINDKNIILFIDELHTIVGAGGAEGAIDASNILKPYLARGSFKLIGATTLKEYNKIIEKDDALGRRFQKVYIKEPSASETLNILKKIKSDYELYHNVKISDNIIKQISVLSSKYIHNKKNPDKSIDLLDEVCAKESITSNENKLIELNKKITYYKEKTKKYLKINDINKATLYKEKELLYKNKLKLLSNKKTPIKIKINTLKEVLESKTNQKIIELENNEKYYKNLKKELENVVYGQKEAIEKIINVTKLSKYKTSLIPLKINIEGPINTGKHLLLETYAKIRNLNLITINAKEYDKETTNNKLLGSVQGYVGYDNENVFSMIKDYPDSIILVENASYMNESLKNIINTITKKGILINNKNEEISFNNNLIFLLDDTYIKETPGFIKEQKIKQNNNYITFNKLNKKNIIKIIKKEINIYNIEFGTKIKVLDKEINNIYQLINNNDNIKIVVQKYLEDILIRI